MEKGHPIINPNIKEMRNINKRRDIQNPSRILQVPKRRRRIRENNALTAINQIMKNPLA
jgi:hypothetical protein